MQRCSYLRCSLMTVRIVVSNPRLIYFLIGKDTYYHDARERDSACVSKNKRKALVGISIIAKTPLFMLDKCGSIIQSRLMIKPI